MFKQITVFLENKPGRMEEVTSCLADEGINIHALSLADTTNFGILRMVLSEPERAFAALKEKNFMAKTTDVLAVAIGHKPGSLHEVLHELSSQDISIEYLYAFTSRHSEYAAIVILSLSDQDAALEKLRGGDFPLLDESLLEQLNA